MAQGIAHEAAKKVLQVTGLYQGIHERRVEADRQAHFAQERVFENRSHGSDRLCIVMAGYKPWLYDVVFGRIARFCPADVDVCVVTSGLWSDDVDARCAALGWSYLSTTVNDVCLVQNTAIELHPQARWIYKVDEDIFVTAHFFEGLYEGFRRVTAEGDIIPSFAAPLIPVNGYGHLRVLKKLGLERVYEQKFEHPVYAAGMERQIERNPDAARFMWGEGGYVPHIDELDARLAAEPFAYTACPVVFSIGAIMMPRALWQDMGMFAYTPGPDNPPASLGNDEKQLMQRAMLTSRPLLVCENTLVGHLSFGQQNAAMKDYFLAHPDRFEILARAE